jgi:hypothetical protein
MVELNIDIQSRLTVKNDSGGIGRLLDEAPEDIPRRNPELVIPAVIRADVHEPDEAALPAGRTGNVPVK